jgi:hypothetical protein
MLMLVDCDCLKVGSVRLDLCNDIGKSCPCTVAVNACVKKDGLCSQIGKRWTGLQRLELFEWPGV